MACSDAAPVAVAAVEVSRGVGPTPAAKSRPRLKVITIGGAKARTAIVPSGAITARQNGHGTVVVRPSRDRHGTWSLPDALSCEEPDWRSLCARVVARRGNGHGPTRTMMHDYKRD